MTDIFKGQKPKDLIDLETGEIKKKHRKLEVVDVETESIITIEAWKND